MLKKFLSFVFISFTFIIMFDKVSAKMLTISEVNEEFTTFLNEFNLSEGSSLSSIINSADSTLDIFDNTEKIVSFNYTDEYIEFDNRDAIITQETIDKYYAADHCIHYIFNSIVKLSGYNWFFISEDIDYSNTFDIYGIQFEMAELDDQYTLQNGINISGYYTKYYKVSLDTDKIGPFISEYASGYDCVNPDSRYYNIKFEVNGGETITNSRICITCSDSLSYEFPVAKKEGYKFEGWYLDENLSNKVESLNNIIFKEAKDSDNCGTGEFYATLYAKWKEVEKVSVPDTGAYFKIFAVLISTILLGIGIYILIYMKKKKLN